MRYSAAAASGAFKKLSSPSLRAIMSSKLGSLYAHGHQDGTRRKILGAYYDACFHAVESLHEDSKESSSCFDGLVKCFYIKSESEKAKGATVVTKINDDTVGLLFVANTPSRYHLTLLEVDKCKIEQKAIAAMMLQTYFEHDGDKGGGMIHTSCVGGYEDLLRALDGGSGSFVSTISGKPHVYFSSAELCKAADKVMAGVDKNPRSAIRVEDSSPVLRTTHTRDLE